VLFEVCGKQKCDAYKTGNGSHKNHWIVVITSSKTENYKVLLNVRSIAFSIECDAGDTYRSGSLSTNIF
jgi:hypothetical protein